MADNMSRLWLKFVRGVEIFLRSFVSRLVLESTQPPIKLVPAVKAAECRTSHPLPSTVVVCIYVDPCVYIPRGPSWPVIIIPLPLTEIISILVSPYSLL